MAEADADLAALEAMLTPSYTDDVSFAFAEEKYEWSILTGKFDTDGKPVALRVVVADPKRSDLPVRFMEARQKDAEKAGHAVVQACVVSPVSLKNPEVWSKLTSAFKSTLLMKLSVFIGMNADFFSALGAMSSPTEPQHQTKSPSPLPITSVATQTKLPNGEPQSSTAAGSQPETQESLNAQTS